MEANVYNQKGKKVSAITLPEKVFAQKWNPDLVHQVVVSMESNARMSTASVKGRSDVRGGGKKPWRQKGTGRARHGSRRSPIWVGGGVTHGPSNEKDYTKKINKKMRAKALLSVLSQKYRDNEILFVDKITFEEPKSKEAKGVLEAWGSIKGFERMASKKKNAALISISEDDSDVKRSFRNLGNVDIKETRSLNPVAVLSSSYLVIENPERALSFLESKLK
ncbi:MAG: 50S ribosomal protein L4 [Patescibacteria group bacterium]